MRHVIFSLTLFVLLTLELGLKQLLVIPRDGGVTPSFTLILMVYVAVSAPRLIVIWSALVIGLCIDLINPLPFINDRGIIAVPLIGPSSLGFLAGAIVVLELRSLVFRQSPIAIGVLVIMSGLIYHLVAVAVLTLRGIPWLPTDAIAHWDISGQLVRRFFELIYSSLMSLPVGFLLLKLDPFFGYGLPVQTARSGAT